MKGILRSKLALTLAAFLMFAAAIVIPLSSTISRSHAAGILRPDVTLSRTSGPAGTLVTATGTGWVPATTIFIAFDSTSLAPFTPSDTNWTHEFFVSSVPLGTYQVVFTQHVQGSTLTVKKPFTVTPSELPGPEIDRQIATKISDALDQLNKISGPPLSLTDGAIIVICGIGSAVLLESPVLSVGFAVHCTDLLKELFSEHCKGLSNAYHCFIDYVRDHLKDIVAEILVEIAVPVHLQK